MYKLFFIFTCIYSSSVFAQYTYELVPEANTYFQSNTKSGYSISMTEEWMFVGIPGYDKPAISIPPLFFPAYTDAGAVEVYHRNGYGEWEYFQRILPMAAVGSYAYFGSSVDASGNKVIIGAPGANYNKGFASSYQFNGTSWVLENTFNPGTQNNNDQFGFSVSIDGDCVAIGSPGRDRIDYSTSPDTNYSNFGAVHNYLYNGSSYSSLGIKYFSTFLAGNGYLGFSVDVNDAQLDQNPGCRVVSGAPYAKSPASGSADHGSVFAYKIYLNNYFYIEAQYLQNSLFMDDRITGQSSGDQLGYAVSMSCINGVGDPIYGEFPVSYCKLVAGVPGQDVLSFLNVGGVVGYFLSPFDLMSTNHQWETSNFIDGTISPVPPANSRFGESVSFNWSYGIVGSSRYNNYQGLIIIYRYNPLTHQLYPYNYESSPLPQYSSQFGYSVSVPTYNTPDTFIGAASSPFYDSSFINIGKAISIYE